MNVGYLTYEQLNEYLTGKDVYVKARVYGVCTPLSDSPDYDPGVCDAHPAEFIIQVQLEHPSVGPSGVIEETILENTLPPELAEHYRLRSEQSASSASEMKAGSEARAYANGKAAAFREVADLLFAGGGMPLIGYAWTAS